jgi:3-hydroxyacyl-CoA dehydrogenase
MSSAVYELHGPVAVITMNNPPVNGLGFDLRREIVEGLARADADAKVKALVLIGSPRAFSGGADIREFGSPKSTAEPSLNTVIRTLEGASKPVIAAIGGACMGGGLELAMACHYRVAAKGAQIALPEVKLGLMPGAGGTQRLPRLVGVEAALNMIVSGEAVPSEQLAGSALFDEMIEGDLLKGALAFAGKIAAEGRALKRARDIKPSFSNAEGFFQFARNTVGAAAKNFPAPLKCVDAVAAAVSLPFDEGMRLERDLFQQLMQSPESRALRHAFFAERAAAKIPDVPEDTPLRKIAKTAVIGAGTMGSGITVNFLSAGVPVTLLEVKREALDKALAVIRGIFEASAKKGRLTAQQVGERMALLKATQSYDDLRDADMAIEAVFEEISVKEAVFRRLDEVMKPGAILASNTSTLDLNRIAGFTRRPQDVVGTHFFSPANVMKLLEVVRGEKTAKDVLATVMGMAKRIKKTAVVSGVCDGFIGNRMVEQYLRQALFLLEEGGTPRQVDRAVEKWGMAMGPFRMSDLAGNDIGWAIRKRRYREQPGLKYSEIADRLCEQGRFGQKTGLGWYRYEAGRRDAIPDPAVEQMIVDYSREIGVQRRKISDGEIVERLIFALVNEGAAILQEGIALRASDIDMVYLKGYGFPLHRGGPMFYADEVGLYNVVASMKAFSANPHGDPGFWKPAPLLASLASEGKRFN